jgi:hypothetical protein
VLGQHPGGTRQGQCDNSVARSSASTSVALPLACSSKANPTQLPTELHNVVGRDGRAHDYPIKHEHQGCEFYFRWMRRQGQLSNSVLADQLEWLAFLNHGSAPLRSTPEAVLHSCILFRRSMIEYLAHPSEQLFGTKWLLDKANAFMEYMVGSGDGVITVPRHK